MNVAVTQMDKVTQSNAANAEESAIASEELSVQAATMNEIVNEWVALVGGAAAQNPTIARSTTTMAKSGKKELSLADHMFHPMTDGKGKVAKNRTTTRASAEKRIPLHDDVHNDDLKDFNG